MQPCLTCPPSVQRSLTCHGAVCSAVLPASLHTAAHSLLLEPVLRPLAEDSEAIRFELKEHTQHRGLHECCRPIYTSLHAVFPECSRTIRSELKEQVAGCEVRGARLAEEVPELSKSHTFTTPFFLFLRFLLLSRVFFFCSCRDRPQKNSFTKFLGGGSQ